ncbi:MAG: exo-alpha-sialidase [Oscillospiraceae bacterium]|nr:exo-alpha-sialidase [Oscillospiraceae bacterium]
MNAKTVSCPVLYKPTDPKYAESVRQFQGCPTIAVTPKGRIYLGWYSGGVREPDLENYNLLIKSDDGGKTWSDPLIVIPSVKATQTHALDIQLWTDPDGKLHVFWVQNDVDVAYLGQKGFYCFPVLDNFFYSDASHAAWEIVCDYPDADEPEFSEPRCYDKGFLRCKPLVLKNGRWIFFNYSQDMFQQPVDRYQYSISDDKGKTFRHMIGSKKIHTPFDETMAYERQDGSIRMFARTTNLGEIAECISTDGGETWTDAVPSGIDSPSSRFYVSRTPSGNVLLIRSDHRTARTNMTICLSEDDGETWKYQRCIDTRDDISYPDADFYDGKIYLTYDRERTGAKEIYFVVFTEDDLKDPAWKPEIRIVSKP